MSSRWASWVDFLNAASKAQFVNGITRPVMLWGILSKSRIAAVDSGTDRLSPFFVSWRKPTRCVISMSAHRSASSSPRRMAVAIANSTTGSIQMLRRPVGFSSSVRRAISTSVRIRFRPRGDLGFLTSSTGFGMLIRHSLRLWLMIAEIEAAHIPAASDGTRG